MNRAAAGMLLLLLTGCSLPLGMKERVTLRLEASGPTLASGGQGRLVTPDATNLELTVLSGGKVLSQTTMPWTPGALSAGALVKDIPVGVPVTINATAFSLEGTERNINALGTASVTLKAGENKVSLFLFPSGAIPAQTLNLAEFVNDLNVLGEDWNLFQFTTPVTAGTATVMLPQGLTAFLQSPDGKTLPVYRSDLTVASLPGTWRLLLWNQTVSAITGSLGVFTDIAPANVSYTLADLTLDIGRGGESLELFLADRPVGSSGSAATIKSKTFSPAAPGSFTVTGLGWDVGPQMELRGRNTADTDSGVYFLDVMPPSTANQVRHLFAYELQGEESSQVVGPVEYSPLYLLDLGLPTVSNVQVTMNPDDSGHVTWNPAGAVAGAQLVGYEVRNTETGGVQLEGTVNTNTDLALPVGNSHVTVHGVYELDDWPNQRLVGHGTAVPVTRVDEEEPVVTMLSPLPSTTLSEDIITVTGTITDNDARLYTVTPTYTWNNGTSTPVTSWDGENFTIEVSGFQDGLPFGVQDVVVTAADPSGNIGTASLSFNTTLDTTAPVIVVQTTPLTFSKADGLTIIGLVVEGGGVDTVTVSTSWNAGAVTPVYTPSTGQWWVVIGTPGMADATEGTDTEMLVLTVTNLAGLVSTETIIVSISP